MFGTTSITLKYKWSIGQQYWTVWFPCATGGSLSAISAVPKEDSPIGCFGALGRKNSSGQPEISIKIENPVYSPYSLGSLTKFGAGGWSGSFGTTVRMSGLGLGAKGAFSEGVLPCSSCQDPLKSVEDVTGARDYRFEYASTSISRCADGVA